MGVGDLIHPSLSLSFHQRLQMSPYPNHSSCHIGSPQQQGPIHASMRATVQVTHKLASLSYVAKAGFLRRGWTQSQDFNTISSFMSPSESPTWTQVIPAQTELC